MAPPIRRDQLDIPFDNLGGTAAPGVGDDSDDGYSIGSRWQDITNGKEYVCHDASVGAAVWIETTYLGHEEDIPPTSPTIYDDEFNTALNSRWAWVGAGEPNAADEKWGLENSRFNMRIASDNGGGPTNYLADLHGIQQDCPSQNFIAYTKLRFYAYSQFSEAGLMLSNNDQTYLFAGIYQDRGDMSLNCRRRVSGSWNDDLSITGLGVGHNVTGVLGLKWVDTGEITFWIGEDYDYLQTYYTWSSIGFTPTKIMLYARQNGSTSLETVVHFVEWFRIKLL